MRHCIRMVEPTKLEARFRDWCDDCDQCLADEPPYSHLTISDHPVIDHP